jgi:hypothetical protein
MLIKKRILIWKRLENAEKINLVVMTFLRLTLLFAIVGSIFAMRWTVVFVSLVTLMLTFLPRVFEKRYKIDIPIELEIVTVLFIYSTLYLGEVGGYYERFWWWDIVLHAGSAMAIGFIGFMILFILYKGEKIKASPITIAIFSFFFALGIGALWEIFEFGMDQIFGLNMQKSGLIDTMWDLIVDSGGALIASVAGYFYIKGKGFSFFDRVIERFVKENPRLFKKEN